MTAVYLIGGVYRAGKSTLARRLMRAREQPYLGLDVLKMALAQTGFPIDPENQPTREMAEALWPLVRALCVNMLDQGDPYIIEGELVPARVDALARERPGQIRACFLGYPHVDRARKLSEIRTFGGGANDWPRQCSDDYLLELIDGTIAASAVLARECRELGLAFFDTSTDFAGALDQAAAYLTAP